MNPVGKGSSSTEIDNCVGLRYSSTGQARTYIFYNFKIKAELSNTLDIMYI